MGLGTCGIENPRWCVCVGAEACDGGVVVVVGGGGVVMRRIQGSIEKEGCCDGSGMVV